MSRQDCLEKARELERLALNTVDPVSRSMLLETARQWRILAVAQRSGLLRAIKTPGGDEPKA